MRLLTRYVLADLMKVFAVALAALTATILLVGVVREAVAQGLPPVAVLRLIPYILPEALRYSVPVTLLLAVTTVYSRMSGFNEVVALKALGISPSVLLTPAIALAFALSLGSVWLNDISGSWGRTGVERVVCEELEDIAYGMLRTDRRYAARSLSIVVKGVEDRRLILPTVTIRERGTTPRITVSAQSAVLSADYRENVLAVELTNGTIDVEGRAVARIPDNYRLEIPLTDASRTGDAANSPPNVPLRQIPEAISAQREEIRRREEEMAVRAAFEMLTGDFDDLTNAAWNQQAAQLAGMRARLCRLRLEPYRRWAAGFSCLCFAWVGAAMGIWLRKPEPLTSFFLCFAPILVVYYPLLIYGINGAKNGTIPPVCVWAGNLVLALWGCWAFKRVLRY